jgi:hypothetical protein
MFSFSKFIQMLQMKTWYWSLFNNVLKNIIIFLKYYYIFKILNIIFFKNTQNIMSWINLQLIIILFKLTYNLIEFNVNSIMLSLSL